MTSTVAGILQSIEGLSLPEQQELIVALCDRTVIDEPLEWVLTPVLQILTARVNANSSVKSCFLD
jgi:hypothetical protein